MSVFVDDMRAPFGRLIMCHMIADTTEELLAMADRIGVDRKWIQHAGTYKEHFDIALSKRALAVAAGAKEITWDRSCDVIELRRCGLLPCGDGKKLPRVASHRFVEEGTSEFDQLMQIIKES